MHEGRPYISHDEPAEFNYEKLVHFRPVIRRILLQNSQSIARGIRNRNLGRSNKVRSVFYTFSTSFTLDVSIGKLRVHYEPPNRH